MIKLCECGCGEEIIIKPYHRYYGIPKYISGHNSKGKKNPFYGKHHTDETKQKISRKGKNHPWFGKHHTAETKRKMSNAHKGKNNPFYGKHLSEEHKQKISEKLSGELNPNYGKHYNSGKNNPMYGKPSPMKGKFFTDEQRRKISEANKGRKHSEETKKKMSVNHADVSGENNPRWHNGASFEPYCQKFNEEFKERVRNFFGRKCFLCVNPENGRKLSVHHVNYDKMVCCNDVKPLFVPLCIRCNVICNNNREFWQSYFEKIIMEKYNGQCYLPKEDEMIGMMKVI